MAMKGNHIDRAPLQSSAFKSAGYHDGTLAIEFTSGGVHHYTGITPDEADAFLHAESAGKHFHQHIKGKDGMKVDAPALAACPACGAQGLAGFLCGDCGTADIGAL